MVQVRRIAYATFETPDVRRLTDYYVEVLGLAVAAQDGNAAFLASPIGQPMVVLRRGDAARCAQLTFQVDPQADPGEVVRALARHDIATQRRTDPNPFAAESILLHDRDGLAVELVRELRFPGDAFASAGIGPLKLGHVAFNVPDAQRTVDFYVDVLGFRVSDWMGDFFAFLRCGPDHHTVNFIRSARTKMHHIAFELRDWAHVHDACDHLAKHGRELIWGPGRHGIGHNIFIYHRNPDGQIVELFTELDLMKDEALGYFEPRPWHQDRPQRPKVWQPDGDASSTWGGPPPADFRE